MSDDIVLPPATFYWQQTPYWNEPAVRAAVEENRATKLTWVDSDGVTHVLSREYATKVLRELYEEWPGGLEEIKAAMKWT